MKTATRLRLFLVAGVVLTVSLVGLGAGERDETRPSTRAPKATVSGRIALQRGWSLQMPDVSQAVAFLAEHPALDAGVKRRASDNRVSNSVEQTSGDPRRDTRAVIGQHDKAFVPDFLVVPKGTTVEFPNWDPFSHNVFSRSRAASFDLDRYPRGMSKRYRFDRPGVVQLFCNIHPKMKAVILVTPNSYFDQADAAGRFQIRDVPLGKYELVVWQERYAPSRQSIRVTAAPPHVISVTLTQHRQVAPAVRQRRRRGSYGVERGLGVKRQQLDLPVVREVHPAPRP